MEQTIEAKKDIWICEECGREHNKLPFPASCKCGNWCEDLFRIKDMYDEEDDKAGVPLCGVKYAPEVRRERNERLGVQKVFDEEKMNKLW